MKTITFNGKETNLSKFITKYLRTLSNQKIFECKKRSLLQHIFENTRKKIPSSLDLEVFFKGLFKELSDEQFQYFLSAKITGQILKQSELYNNPYDFTSVIGGNSLEEITNNKGLEKLAQMKADGKIGEFRFYAFFCLASLSEMRFFNIEMDDADQAKEFSNDIQKLLNLPKIPQSGNKREVSQFINNYMKELRKRNIFEENKDIILEIMMESLRKNVPNIFHLRCVYEGIFKQLSQEQFNFYLSTKVATQQFSHKRYICSPETHLNPYDFTSVLGGNTLKELEDNGGLVKLAQMKLDGEVAKFRFYAFFCLTTRDEVKTFDTLIDKVTQLLKMKKTQLLEKREQIQSSLSQNRAKHSDLCEKLRKLNFNPSSGTSYGNHKRFCRK